MNAARHSHAPLDLESRARKALKIARILNLSDCNRPMTILEIGTGSGGIAHYLATHDSQNSDVFAVDVRDIRVVTEGYEFSLVTGTALPYDDLTFDVVISNHVIEHVGTAESQKQHLQEIYRVLKDDGIGYLAVPNRWMLIEPHYRLLFLSWLPPSLRSRYLSLMGKGDFYDCEPLELKQLELLLKTAGFEAKNVCVQAIREMLDIEKLDSVAARIVRLLPDRCLNIFSSIIPTLIYTLRKRAQPK